MKYSALPYMLDEHKVAEAILDALEGVGDGRDYYNLNHASKERIDELKEFLNAWLKKVLSC